MQWKQRFLIKYFKIQILQFISFVKVIFILNIDVRSMSGRCQVDVRSMPGRCQVDVISMSCRCHVDVVSMSCRRQVDVSLSFLGVHPFSNANGRTIKFLIWNVLKSFYQVKTFYTISYSTWCSIVYHKLHDSLLDWFQTMIY